MSEPVYELTVSKRGLDEHKGKLVENIERLQRLPDKPEFFRPLVGSYARVSGEAVRRNETQIRSGFLDYIYAPEPHKAKLDVPKPGPVTAGKP